MGMNSLGVAISKPDKVLVIMRGISGGGKSTKAKTLVGDGCVHSTDSLIEAAGDYRTFFAEMVKTGSFVNLSRMHSKNLVNAKKSMDEGISPVVIDNTNLRANEPKAYVKHALEIGYADENIQIVDIGTGGLTAEALAARNSHGVPLEKIVDMIKTHKTVGDLTLQKILQAKDMYPQSDVLYSAVILDDKSKGLLLKTFGAFIPEGWKTIAHHMTIAFGKPVKNKEDLGKEVKLKVVKLGITDMVIAVQVEGYESTNSVPHITLAVNPNGGKPAMSNDITDWKDYGNLYGTNDAKLIVTGIVSEIKKS